MNECCHRCADLEPDAIKRMVRGMLLCPMCGNKRCPRASDHRLDCSGSNEPGQAGSVY